MKHATLALVAAFAAIVATAETSRTATENWTRNRIGEATNATLQAAKEYADAHGGDVQSVNGKTGTVVLAAADVHALPDTYTPPAAPVQSVNSKTGAVSLNYEDVGAWNSKYEVAAALALGYHGRDWIGGTPPYSMKWDSTEKRWRAQWALGEITVYDWMAYLSDLNGYVPTTRKVNGQPLTSDITIEGMTDNAAVLTNGALKTKSGTAITAGHVGAATPQQVNEVDAKADETRAVVVTLAGQINGSNVVFVVTNYLSGAYVLDAAKLQIRELRDGSYRTIYNSRDEIRLHLADFETNKLNVTRETLRQEIAAVLESMQHDAWGRRTSTGNPAPSNTIYTTEPSFVFGGGLEYERIAVGAGAIGVLADKGAPSYTAGDSGTFLFKDATGENYFGYSMTTGYAIGVPTDGIQVSGQLVTLTYNIVGSCPIIMWCPALFPGCASDITGPGWYQLNDEEGNPIEGAPFECAVDMESTPEVATVYIDTGANPTGFFSAWTSVPGKSSFKTNMPVDLDAANGGGVVSSDGHTVIVPQPDGTWRPSNAN